MCHKYVLSSKFTCLETKHWTNPESWQNRDFHFPIHRVLRFSSTFLQRENVNTVSTCSSVDRLRKETLDTRLTEDSSFPITFPEYHSRDCGLYRNVDIVLLVQYTTLFREDRSITSLQMCSDCPSFYKAGIKVQLQHCRYSNTRSGHVTSGSDTLPFPPPLRCSPSLHVTIRHLPFSIRSVHISCWLFPKKPCLPAFDSWAVRSIVGAVWAETQLKTQRSTTPRKIERWERWGRRRY